MSHIKFYFLILSCIVYSSLGLNLPSSIKPCKRNSPDLNKCILKEAKKFHNEIIKGLPEFGIPVLDPMKLGDTVISSADNGVTVKAIDVVVTGLKQSALSEFKFNKQKKTISLTWKGNLKIKLGCDVTGTLASIPINNKGNLEINGEAFDVKMKMNWNLIKGKDNKEHLNITKSSVSFEVGPGQFKVDGFISKEMDMTMTLLLTQHWDQIIKDLGKPAMNVLKEKFVLIMNKIFAGVSYDKLIPI